MRYLAILLAAVFAFQSTTSFAGGPSCEDVFVKHRTLSLKADPLPTDSKDPAFKARITDLLDMYLNSVFQENEKDPFKKRELFFAREIGSGETLEFEYLGDQRSGERVYRLSKISLYKANGKDITLEKEALSDDGQSLRKKSFELEAEDGATPNEINDIAIPLTIEGEALKALTPWLQRIPHLTKIEIKSAVDRGRVSPLVWKAAFLSNLKFLAKTAKKQLFKTVLLVGVVAGIQQIPYAQLINPIPKAAPTTQVAPEAASNQTLLVAMEDQSKILVISTETGKTSKAGAVVVVSKEKQPALFAQLSRQLAAQSGTP
ncbi:MAG: hypothetical protein EOP05_02620 [Proteobacteria bacterium]|nr:MAG: hypothetical protein EOP05_02620 [Pseudomonadota bacterium]